MPCYVVQEGQEEQETGAVQQKLAPFAFPLDGVSSRPDLALGGIWGRQRTIRVAKSQEAVFTGVTPVGVYGEQPDHVLDEAPVVRTMGPISLAFWTNHSMKSP